MPSSGRNIRRAESLRRSRALGAGLALALLSGAALADGAHQFVFTTYSDAAGGADLLAGRYGAAVEKLEEHAGAMDPDSSAINTNRCVAYSMTLRWREARAACDAAVRTAREQRLSSAWWSWSPGSDEDFLAVAYANRAVMHWLLNDEAAARNDLAQAQQLLPQADFVARNVVALRAHGLLAQTRASAPRR